MPEIADWLATSGEDMVRGLPVYEVRPRKDRRGFDLFPKRCRSVAFGMATRPRGHRLREILQPITTGRVRVFDAAGAMISAENWPGGFPEAVSRPPRSAIRFEKKCRRF